MPGRIVLIPENCRDIIQVASIHSSTYSRYIVDESKSCRYQIVLITKMKRATIREWQREFLTGYNVSSSLFHWLKEKYVPKYPILSDNVTVKGIRFF